MAVIQTSELGISLVSSTAQSTILNGGIPFKSIQHFILQIFSNNHSQNSWFLGKIHARYAANEVKYSISVPIHLAKAVLQKEILLEVLQRHLCVMICIIYIAYSY